MIALSGGDAIGGIITNGKGPEAGVWVIAEAKHLPECYGRCCQ